MTDSPRLIPDTGFGTLLIVILAGGSAVLLLLAAASLLHWWVPAQWFTPLVVAGAVMSIGLQIIYISPWAVFPLLVDVALLYAVLGLHMTVSTLRG